MTQLKKKQHYVWQEYLKAWCSTDRIYTYLKFSNNAIFTNLDGVAQERFHYSLQEYTIEEEIVLREAVQHFSHPDVKDMNLDFYTLLTAYSKIKRELSKKNLPKSYQEELNKKLNLLQKNTTEDIHARVESLGKDLIIADSVEKLEVAFNDKNRLLSFAFICMQYHRTKKMRLAYENLAKDHRYLKEKYADVISIVFANGLAWGLAFFQKCKIILLKNETNITLLTGDQPAINIKDHEKNDKGYVDDFELYYPLTPKYALSIQPFQEENSIEESSLKLEEVIRLNKLVFDHSENFVFGIKDCSFPI